MGVRFSCAVAGVLVLGLVLLCGCHQGGARAVSRVPCCRPPFASIAGGAASGLSGLGIVLSNDSGRPVHLCDLLGRPVLIALFFTHCQLYCPMTVDNLRAVRASLSEAERARIPVVLVSFDPLRDTPERLREFRRVNRLPADWTLLTGAERDVRELAARLGVRFQETAPGRFAHSTQITLLDAEGRPVHQQQELNAGLESMAAAVRVQLGSGQAAPRATPGQ